MVLVLDGKTDLNQISLTGVRAITLIGLLAVAPRTLKEIRNAFLEYKIMEESSSDDILRIDLNTIKSFGCKILRSSAKTGYKYILTKHPFTIPITERDVKILKRLFDKIKNSLEISKLIECDRFLDKLSEYIYDDSIKEMFLGISPLKYYDLSMINELVLACNQRYIIKLLYQKQYVRKPIKKEIIAQRLVFKNDKLYLYGYDLEKQASVTLYFKRIKSIISKHITDKGVKQNELKVKFVLKDFDANLLTEEEKIIKSATDGFLIEGNYFNEFLATQRILSFGSKCTVCEPLDFRQKIISKLKEMRMLYEKE